MMFLTTEEVSKLTGRRRKSCQIYALRSMGIPFYVNACGQPIVCRSAVEGRKEEMNKACKEWSPKVLAA